MVPKVYVGIGDRGLSSRCCRMRKGYVEDDYYVLHPMNIGRTRENSRREMHLQ